MALNLFDQRALLFLPASNPRAIAKARASDADLVILDLEDAVKPEDKASARAAAVAAIAQDWPMPVAIRINGVGSDEHDADLAALAGSPIATSSWCRRCGRRERGARDQAVASRRGDDRKCRGGARRGGRSRSIATR